MAAAEPRHNRSARYIHSTECCAATGAFKMYGSLPIGDRRKVELLIAHPWFCFQLAIRLMELNAPGRGIVSLRVRAAPLVKYSYCKIRFMQRLRSSIGRDVCATRRV